MWSCRRAKDIHKSKSSHYTLVMAMSVSEVQALWVFPKGLTKERWEKFITKHLIDVLNELMNHQLCHRIGLIMYSKSIDHVGAGLVQSDDFHINAHAIELHHDFIKGGNGCDVPEM